MATEHIVQLLIQERDRLNRAIEALQGAVNRPGRPSKGAAKPARAAEAPATMAADSEQPAEPVKKRKGFSAATKRKMALAQKKRWAAKKAVS